MSYLCYAVAVRHPAGIFHECSPLLLCCSHIHLLLLFFVCFVFCFVCLFCLYSFFFLLFVLFYRFSLLTFGIARNLWQTTFFVFNFVCYIIVKQSFPWQNGIDSQPGHMKTAGGRHEGMNASWRSPCPSLSPTLSRLSFVERVGSVAPTTSEWRKDCSNEYDWSRVWLKVFVTLLSEASFVLLLHCHTELCQLRGCK